MEARHAVLEMGVGKQFLTFPGPGGYDLVFHGEPTRIPLRKAMSGHLMAPLVAYDQISRNVGVKSEDPVLHATDTPLATPRKSRDSANQALNSD